MPDSLVLAIERAKPSRRLSEGNVGRKVAEQVFPEPEKNRVVEREQCEHGGRDKRGKRCGGRVGTRWGDVGGG